MNVRLKKLDQELPTPAYAHEGDAGCDLYSAVDRLIRAGERELIPTGIALSIPEGYAGFLQPRSGLALKHGLSLVNTPGLIDSKYRGELKVILVNLDPRQDHLVRRADRICQLVVQKVESVRFEIVQNLDETTRSGAGFGSTG